MRETFPCISANSRHSGVIPFLDTRFLKLSTAKNRLNSWLNVFCRRFHVFLIIQLTTGLVSIYILKHARFVNLKVCMCLKTTYLGRAIKVDHIPVFL